MNNDLISRQAVIKAIHDEREWLDANIQSAQHHYHMMNETARILGIIGNLPAVQPKQKTGRWEFIGEEIGAFNIRYPINKCSECGWTNSHFIPEKFCSNCGAKMESDNNDS